MIMASLSACPLPSSLHSPLRMPHWEAQWRTALVLPSKPAAEGLARDSPPDIKPNKDVLQRSLHTAKDIFWPRSGRDVSQGQGITTTEVIQQCPCSFQGAKRNGVFKLLHFDPVIRKQSVWCTISSNSREKARATAPNIAPEEDRPFERIC